MKKAFTLLLLCLTIMNSIEAQQVIGNFNYWEDCFPAANKLVGKQPFGWSASNVYQVIVGKEFVFPDTDRLNNGNGQSARLTNDFVGALGIGANAPAFVTLGKMWVWADMAGMLAGADTSDGGVYGGVDFTYRPDSLTLYIKRKLGTEKPNEQAKIIAYLWKGEFKSRIPVGKDDNGLIYTDVIDQDKYVLGREAAFDGSTGVLIGKVEYAIDGNVEEWQRVSIPINYLNNDTPEKMNVILSSGNFWVRADIGKDNSLWVDDLAFVYNNKLNAITLNGQEIIGFDADRFTYQLPYADKDKELSYVPASSLANISVDSFEDNVSVTKTITVNFEGNTNAYTVIFKGGQGKIGQSIELTYGSEVEDLGFTAISGETEFIYKSSNEGVIVYDKVTKKLKAVGIGTSEVTAYTMGTDDYSSAASAPLTVTVVPATLTISLAEGAWCERGVNLSATNMTNGKCHYEIIYDGFKYNDTPENTLSKVVSVSANYNKQGETIGDLRPVTLSGAESSKYNIVYAPDQKLTVTKTTLNVYVGYGSSKFDSDKEDEKSHKIGVKPGEDSYPLVISYSGFVLSENVSILGGNLPVASCEINKDSPIGTSWPVSLTLPEIELENYNLVSKLPDDAALVVKKTAVIKYEPLVDKKYGDEPFFANMTVEVEEGEEPVAITFSTTSSTVLSVDKNTGIVTIKKAGLGKVTATTVENANYLSNKMSIEFTIGKAPLIVKAENAERMEGEENPDFILTYDGFIGEEDENTKGVFTTMPSVSCEADVDSPVGDYDIVVEPGVAANYEITPVNGKLTIKSAGVSLDKTTIKDVNISSENGALYIKGNNSRSLIQVFNAQGVAIAQSSAEEFVVNQLTLNTICIVKVGDQTNSILVR